MTIIFHLNKLLGSADYEDKLDAAVLEAFAPIGIGDTRYIDSELGQALLDLDQEAFVGFSTSDKGNIKVHLTDATYYIHGKTLKPLAHNADASLIYKASDFLATTLADILALPDVDQSYQALIRYISGLFSGHRNQMKAIPTRVRYSQMLNKAGRYADIEPIDSVQGHINWWRVN